MNPLGFNDFSEILTTSMDYTNWYLRTLFFVTHPVRTKNSELLCCYLCIIIQQRHVSVDS